MNRTALQSLALLALLLGPGAYPQALAAKVDGNADSQRPRIGLVLGGGGARGSAHVGVIRALEELHVPVDYVVGTSMGALIGGLYATGMNADEMEAVLAKIDWDDIFDDQTPREDQPFRRKRDDDLALFGPKLGLGKDSSVLSTGLIAGQKLSFLFESLVKERTQVTDFDKLPVPFRAVAADVATGEQIVFDHGDLAFAMRASMSIPGVFRPVEWQDRILVDGGIVNNVPVSVAREMGADIVIAVNVGSGLVAKEDIRNILSVVDALVSVMIERNVALQLDSLGEADVLIQPPLGKEVTSYQFELYAKAIDIGYREAAARRDALAALAVSPQAYRAHMAARQAREMTAPVIEFVQIDNRSHFSDEVIASRLHVPLGEPLDVAALGKDIRGIYGLGYLGLVRHEVVRKNGRTGLVLHVEQDSRGTHLLEWGLDYFGDANFNGINLRLGYLNAGIDDFGSELRVLGQVGRDPGLLVDLYKYFSPAMNYFAQASLFAESFDLLSYNDDGQALSQVEVNQAGGRLGLGRELGHHASLSAGIRLFGGDAQTNIGVPKAVDYDFRGGEYYGRLSYDRMDDRYVPSRGSRVDLSYYRSSGALNADDRYQQGLFSYFSATTWGRHTVWAGARYDTTLSGSSPPYVRFRYGGFLNLSGFHDGQLTGQHAGLLAASYQYHMTQGGLVPGRIGFSVEYGNAAERASKVFDEGIFNGSIFAGFRTPIGPAYLGIGFAEGGKNQFFLRIGKPFDRTSFSR
jgi:NTE family protein